MKIKLSSGAERDIQRGCDFYRSIDLDLAKHFNECIATDIESLLLYAGIHASIGGWHYTFSRRFPFVIWYGVHDDVVVVYAILDARQDPLEHDATLRERRTGSGSG